MYNKTCFRISSSWVRIVKIKKIVKRMLGKSIKITFPQQVFHNAFIKRSFIRDALCDATKEFYEEASALIVDTAVREAENICEGETISVSVDNLEDALPPEVHLGLCLSISDKIEKTGLEYYDECNRDTFVFRKPKSSSRA